MDQSPTSDATKTDGRNDGAVLSRLAALFVTASWRNALGVLFFAAILTAFFGYFALNHLKIDTKTSQLLDPSLPWRQDEIAYNDMFPQNKHVLAVVVQGATPELAAKAADDLNRALQAAKGPFGNVTYLEGLPFFQKDGLLFLKADELTRVTEELIAAQGMLGQLAADPTLNGLFSALNDALDGVIRGDIKPDTVLRPLTPLVGAIEANLSGQPTFLPWGKLFTGQDPALRETLRVITVKPALDYSTLSPGRRTREAVEKIAQNLGLTPANGVSIHFTGDVALDDDELASVKQGVGLATTLSLVLVLGLLIAGIRSPKAVLAILITLLAGLIATVAFAAATVHTLNLVSVAFVVMFIGIAVDFGIQFSVRFRDERAHDADPGRAIAATGRSLGGALSLAAMTTAIGFLAFLPTSYRGVAELGIIAGAGMLIALLLNLTLLPALLRYLLPAAKSEPPHLLKSPAADEWILRHRRLIIGGAVLLAAGALALLPRLEFDFNPLHLKDPNAPSVRTLKMLADAGLSSPNTMQILVRDRTQIDPLVPRLDALPGVKQVISIDSFIPKDQDRKLAIISDAAFLLAPTFTEPNPSAAPAPEVTLQTISKTVLRLRDYAQRPDAPESLTHFSEVLDQVVQAGPSVLPMLQSRLMGGLPTLLSSLALRLQAEPVTFETLPEPLKRLWIAPDERARIEVRAEGRGLENSVLTRFVSAVRSIAPDATGPAYFIQKSGEAVSQAFLHAFIYALIGVIAVLAFVLRRIWDVGLIVGPLLLSALLTLGAAVLIGLPLNFANVIALPLLMGIGVAFNVYFVTNWRLGRRHPLRSSTARAVLFSALTTLAAVSSLALSPHAGTASMGLLLTLCLTMTLFSALIILPALLGPPRTQ